MGVEPPLPVRDALVVVGRRGQPVRRPLEDEQLGGLLGDDGDELRGARPRADHPHPPAAQIDVVVPPGRVEGRPGKRVQARDVRHEGPVELADGADDGIGLQAFGRPVRVPHHERPSAAVVVVHGGADLGAEADEGAQAELVGTAAEVGQQRALRGVVLGPVVLLGEGVAVEVVRVVDPAPGIGVLPPGPADLLVLLEHDEGHPGLGQPMGGEQARHPSPDDGDGERTIGRHLVLVPGRCPAVVRRHAQLLLEERQIVLHLAAPDGELHELQQQLVRRRCRRRAAVVTPSGKDTGRDRPDPRLLIGREPGLRLVGQQGVDT